MTKKILMFAGSARKESFNKKLIVAVAGLAKIQGVEVTVIDLKDFPLPIYDGDFEEKKGPPENAKKLYDLIDAHDYLIIASPEYNGLPSPLLKNTIDWVSRVDFNVFKGKVAAIMSASPGTLGGQRGLTHLRTLLNNLNVITIPQHIAIGGASGAFRPDGGLKDEKQQTKVSDIINALLAIEHQQEC